MSSEMVAFTIVSSCYTSVRLFNFVFRQIMSCMLHYEMPIADTYRTCLMCRYASIMLLLNIINISGSENQCYYHFCYHFRNLCHINSMCMYEFVWLRQLAIYPCFMKQHNYVIIFTIHVRPTASLCNCCS